MDSVKTDICKYCLQTASELGEIPLITPCKCSNPVCRQCLWMQISKNNRTSCELCLEPYQIDGKTISISYNTNANTNTEPTETTFLIDSEQVDTTTAELNMTGAYLLMGFFIVIIIILVVVHLRSERITP